MFAARPPSTEREGEIVLISSDAAFVEAVKGVFGANGRLKMRIGRHVGDDQIDLSSARIWMRATATTFWPCRRSWRGSPARRP
jgi:hypothetical protein